MKLKNQRKLKKSQLSHGAEENGTLHMTHQSEAMSSLSLRTNRHKEV